MANDDTTVPCAICGDAMLNRARHDDYQRVYGGRDPFDYPSEKARELVYTSCHWCGASLHTACAAWGGTYHYCPEHSPAHRVVVMR